MDCQTVRTEVHIEPESAAIQTHIATCERCAAYVRRMARLDQALRHELVVPAPVPLASRLQSIAVADDVQSDRLDIALRDELLMSVPAVLSERLLALVPEPARVMSRVDEAIRDALVVQAPPQLTAQLESLVSRTVATPAAPSVPTRPRRWVIATVYFVTAALLMLSLMYAGQVYGLVIAQLGLEAWLAQIAGLPAELLDRLYEIVPQSRLVVGALVRLQQPLQWLLIGLIMWAVLDMSQRSATGHHPKQEPA